MLHQISWFTYSVSSASLVFIYYLYVAINFYRAELQGFIYKLAGRKPTYATAAKSDLQIPDYSVIGQAEPSTIEFIVPEELSFGPMEIPDESESGQIIRSAGSDKGSVIDYSEMLSEVKTLILVINESGESKENFEMLFRLIIQKYPAIKGTGYQQQINEYLLTEGVPEFPFSLDTTDLNNYWTEN